jgi:hypothetical protein
MSDIVKRLREGCGCNYPETTCMAEDECRDAFEAADTITRLRADIISYKIGNKDLQDHCTELTNLTAEVEQNRIDLEEYRRDVERLRAALEKAEGGFYNMANAIDDYDYHGPAPQCTGDIIGHREQFHRVHVEQLVKYAEECRAEISGDKHE